MPITVLAAHFVAPTQDTSHREAAWGLRPVDLPLPPLPVPPLPAPLLLPPPTGTLTLSDTLGVSPESSNVAPINPHLLQLGEHPGAWAKPTHGSLVTPELALRTAHPVAPALGGGGGGLAPGGGPPFSLIRAWQTLSAHKLLPSASVVT